MDYQLAEQEFRTHNYIQAFSSFKKIAEDESVESTIRANSFTMMGVIINGFADLEEDDSGIKYFRKAIELDPYNLGALLNIVSTFGTDPSMHQETDLFRLAYDRLTNNLKHMIGLEDLNKIKSRFKVYEDLVK